jgi:hypothetical protein
MAAVRPGRTATLNLTPAQQATLSDPEGLHALSILAHLLAAQDAAGERGYVLLTEWFVLWLARRLGLPVGRNGARRVVRRLVEAKVIRPAGSYRQAYGILPRGHRVPRFRVAVPVWLGSRQLRTTPAPRRLRSATSKACVATRRKVKSRAWWKHPLFGNPGGCPPLDLGQKKRKLWLSKRHRLGELLRDAECCWEEG